MSAPEQQRILVVDDEESLRRLIDELLRARGFGVATAQDGWDALELLTTGRFDLVVSDIAMPGLNGMGLLAEIVRHHPEVGVVMLTGCEDISTAVAAMKAGALDYVLKPFRPDDLVSAVKRALDRRREAQAKAERMNRLEQAVLEQTSELRRLLAHLNDASEVTLEALVTALDAREHETKAHSRRVGEYTVHLARTLGADSGEVEVMRQGAMLHDIGKIGIPDRILLKPGRLSDAEWQEMRRHPQIGYWILRGIEALRPAAEIVLAHHERYDGGGYPRGLRGGEIPLGARIFSVADTLDAITSDRPYQLGRPYPEARREIAANAGLQFDPEVVKHFLGVPPAVWSEIRERTGGSGEVPVSAVPLVLR